MTTGTFVSQLDALAKKVEFYVQSLQSAEIHPSKYQYTTFKALSLRLCDAAAAVPVEIEALKKRQAESCEEGQKLISQAESDRNDVIHLKNRAVFARNLKLFFGGPQDSFIDSDTIKARKRLTRERCERISSLSPDGIISWAVAFAPSLWTANLMSNKTFDCVEEQIGPQEPVVWPSEIYDTLSALGDEEPLRGSHKYHEFLKAAKHQKEKFQCSNQPRKRRRLADGPATEVDSLPPVQTDELFTQTPASQSGRVQLPGLRQMALVAPSMSGDQTQVGEDSAIDSRYGDGNEQRHGPLHYETAHPYKENREMKDMYTNAPARNISKMPEPFRTAIENSRLWQWERSQNMETTECWPSLFPKNSTQDVSFTIWCEHEDGEYLTKFFGSELALSS